ncbi:hypothetical protein ACP4OV_029038 [Aristida adscensionis]
MDVIKIKADNISRAADDIIGFLNSPNTADVIYFNGCSGLGASAVLKEVVKKLRSSLSGAATGTARGVNKIIHIDCSLWVNKRALQKAIAKELELPLEVMSLFSQWDKEDDFDGVEQGARGVIPSVTQTILDDLQNRRFLVVFHNGSENYIDLREFGVPVMWLIGERVLWTSQGRFRIHVTGKDDEDEVKDLAGLSDVAIYHDLDGDHILDCLWSLLYAEAEEVANYTAVLESDMRLKIIVECIFYIALRGKDNNIDWGTHASNYWVCDGIIQASTDGTRSAWEIGDALCRNMNLGWHKKWIEAIRATLSWDEQCRYRDRWISASHQHRQDLEEENNHDYDSAELKVPSQATSLFWTTAGPSMDNNASRILEYGMFKHSDRSSLRVIHLSQCTFSFSFPPFSSCDSLRFLLLDHCIDKDPTPAVDCSGEGKHHDRYKSHDRGACFRKLWVLHLSFTDWHWLLSEDAMDLMAELRELNVKGVTNWSISHLCRNSGAERNSSCGLLNLVTLRVTSQPTDVDSSCKNPASPLVAFPDLSSSIILKKVVLDGLVELEELGLNALPPSLESFSFTSNVNTNIKRMCFRGCTKLECVLLKGLFGNLAELDMSGTAVRSLDLSATKAPKLSRLFLLGCEKLSAILWPPQKIELDVLHIDTTQAAWTRKDKSTKEPRDDMIVGSSSAVELGCSRAPPDFDVYIVLRDSRLLRSLTHARVNKYFHIEISSIAAASNVVSVGGHKGNSQATKSSTTGGTRQVRARSMSLQKLAGNFYADITNTFNDCSQEIMWMWPCPVAPTRRWDGKIGHCKISIEDKAWIKLPHGTASTKQGGTRATTLPDFVHVKAGTLHLHDSFSITCIPGPASPPPATLDLSWDFLRWCRLERCPNLEGTVFTAPACGEGRRTIFRNLETFWASQLVKAYCIWDWSASSFQPEYASFEDLELLHIDFCPRLIHVLPLTASNSSGCRRLKTLEIVCCGNLKEVFPLLDYSDSEEQEGRPRAFPYLERIHLHELPKLQHICGRRMYAPNLKTVKIRGCWSLKRLPAVRCSASKPPPEVDCEEDWWDGLEWDGVEVDYHPSRYRLSENPRLSARWGKRTEAFFWGGERPFGHHPSLYRLSARWGKTTESFYWDEEELVGHHPSLYKASHSQYHKKPLLKASVLR